jgi:hypothetical protein
MAFMPWCLGREADYVFVKLIVVLRFEILTAMEVYMMFFWVLALCKLVYWYQSFLQTYHFSPEDGNIIFFRNAKLYPQTNMVS